MRKDEEKANVFLMKLLLCFVASKFLLREQHRMRLKDEDKENARTYVSEALALCSHGGARIRL
jgi:hypothetical protein